MNQIYLVSKPNCPQCHSLKMFLKMALRDKYADDIKICDQELDEELYYKIVKEFRITSLPALVSGDDILRQCDPTPTVQFLEKHAGKK